MTITFVGHGYVGLVTAAVFADLGNTVWVIGHTKEKIDNLKSGILPIYEPGLSEIVKRNVVAGRLLFTLDYDQAIPASDVIFIAVGTPPKANGEADLSVVFSVAEEIGKHLDGYSVLVVKSTVPIGTNNKVKEIVEKVKKEKAVFDIGSVPEFLREGQAISDTLNPDRVVIGTEEKKAAKLLLELHMPIGGKRIITNLQSAEMIKYASNGFLAAKISFANAIAHLSELTGADGLQVLSAVGLDKRIGSSFLSPGAGYGGSCFPKDVKALIAIADNAGYDFSLLKAVEEINRETVKNISNKALKLLGENISGKKVGILGLSFKPDTDDMREAPSLSVIKELQKKGVVIKVYDPIAMANTKKLTSDVQFCRTSYEVAEDVDLLIFMTEWNEFKQLDLARLKKSMKQPMLLDGRNIFDPEKARELGFIYVGVGR